MIDETQSRHNREPITQDEYDGWRLNPVTIRLLESLELSVIDSYQDYQQDTTTDLVAMSIMTRQGAYEMVDHVLEWSPAGVRSPTDEN